ncbi:MAG: prepilin-type N-terminal cleavage/methylation domain-containing protein [Polyangiaceae bacterium]|nr:prepilin-type N-terminal cleavage/methylation domain-containing protein [Polyangiaceae bacterium]
MKRSPPTRSRLGITLIEVMVAISIFSIVATLVYSAFIQTARHKANLELDLDRHHVIEAALERMARELSMAFVSAQKNPSPSLVTMNSAFIGTDRGRRDRVDFTSFSHRRLFRDAHESDQNEISYFLASHPTRSGELVLARREQNRIDHDPTKGGRVQILLEGIKELEFEYLDPTTHIWQMRLSTQNAADQPNRLPSQVKIRIRVEDPRDPRRTVVFGTRAVLPLTYGLNHAVYNQTEPSR